MQKKDIYINNIKKGEICPRYLRKQNHTSINENYVIDTKNIVSPCGYKNDEISI